MTGKRALLVIALLLLAAPQLWAAPAIVNIQLLPGTPRTIQALPRAEVLCRNSQSCPTEISYRWTGPDGREGEKLEVKFLAGLYWQGDLPQQVAASECFTFPDGGTSSFELEHGVHNSRTVAFKMDSESCPDKVFFFYEVSCKGGKGGNCDGIPILDPGMMIDNG